MLRIYLTISISKDDRENDILSFQIIAAVTEALLQYLLSGIDYVMAAREPSAGHYLKAVMTKVR